MFSREWPSVIAATKIPREGGERYTIHVVILSASKKESIAMGGSESSDL